MTAPQRFVPDGWITAPIGDLCDLINGRGFKKTEWQDSGLPIIRIQNLKDSSAKFNYYQGSYDDKILIQPGELLFAWSGTPGTSFGAFRWDGPTGLLNQHIFRVVFDDECLSPAFFRYAINERLNSLIGAAQGGVGLRHVTKGTLTGTEILLPPVSEQRRIADKLDAVLARVDACRERLDRIPIILERFRQSVMAAATSGKLTEDWHREAPALGSALWSTTPLANLLAEGSKISYGVLKPGPQDDEGVDMYRVVDIGMWGERTDTIPSRISTSLAREYERTKLEEGDILISVMATIGRSMCATPEMVGANVNRAIAVIKPNRGRVNSKYLLYWLLSPNVQRHFEETKLGSAQPRINLSDLRQLEVPLPSIDEQREVVRRVEALFTQADTIEKRFEIAESCVKRLTPALLASAFRGDLVPQDPGDEPAAALLRRIHEKRAAAPPKHRKRARRPRTVKKNEVSMVKHTEIEDQHLSTILRERGPLTAEALWSASQLEIDEFYDQLKVEEERGLLVEKRGDAPTDLRILEAVE